MRIALTSLFLVGCVIHPSTDDVGGEGGGGTGSGGGSGSGSGSGSGTTTTTPPPPVASGAYQVRSEIDLTVEALLPEPAADMVETLRSFSTNPAETLFDLAESAGVPAVGTIRDALPSYLEDKLYGWIDGEIAKVTLGGVPVTQIAGDIAAMAETALTQFALDSEMNVQGGVATHTLKTIDFTPAGLDQAYSLDTIPDVIVSRTATCTSTATTFSIGDHTYGLPYGELAWTAVNDAMIAQHGMDIRASLGAAVNCPAIAATVAQKCVWSVCVGHEAELTAICEKGLDEVVERARAKFASMKFEALHFQSGTATLVDANKDGTAEALANGVWTAELNAGMGLRHVPATFTATK
jgi:hypothetical protein